MLYYFIKYKLPTGLFFIRHQAERLIDLLNVLAT